LFNPSETKSRHAGRSRRWSWKRIRDYGYYVLPVLYGDRLIARMDPEFDRVNEVFTVRNWSWEREVNRWDDVMLAAIGNCLAAFGTHLDAKEIRLGPDVKREAGLVRVLKQ
jgi:uncharacterized protein